MRAELYAARRESVPKNRRVFQRAKCWKTGRAEGAMDEVDRSWISSDFSRGFGQALLGCGGDAADDRQPKNLRTRGGALVARPEARIFSEFELFTPAQRPPRGRRGCVDGTWPRPATDSRAARSTRRTAPPTRIHRTSGRVIRARNICRRSLRSGCAIARPAAVDEAAAARYGAAGARVLEAMSTPVGSGGQPPQTDCGLRHS